MNRSTSESLQKTIEATKEKIEAELRKRITQYQQAIASQNQQNKIAFSTSTQPLNILAEGDSWFDYPIGSDVIGCIENNAEIKPNILNLAEYGDVTTNILGTKNRNRIIEALKDEDNGDFDAILFSGGGNDLVGDAFCLWIKDYVSGSSPNDGIHRARLEAMLTVVESAYIDLFEIRNIFAPNCPVFIHGYDFALPTGDKACWVGPWLKPSLDYRNWTDFNLASELVKEILLAFHNLLEKLETNYSNVIYVRTQGTLKEADWANELHPNEKGFKKISNVFLRALEHRFNGRI